MNAVYPGTFDPFTNGHLDVARRGADLFGSLTVAVAASGGKEPLFPLAARVRMIRSAVSGLKGVRVASFSGTLVEYLRRARCRVVLRGLRTLSDYDYEVQLALFNRQLDPRVETLFVVASPEHAATSSKLVREVASLGQDVSELVPGPVLKALKARFRRRRRK
ncbi:MAG: pantetheine-phosphate adenylyltransferase [Planctomycetota bacterium]|jgi:pantetheine-phosphate adenylyltransferase